MHDSSACLQVYYVWYGGWGNLKNNGTTQRPSTVKVLTDLAQSIGGQAWFNMMTTYSDSSGPVVNKITYGGKTGITAGSKCWQVRVSTLSPSVSLPKASITQPGVRREGRAHIQSTHLHRQQRLSLTRSRTVASAQSSPQAPNASRCSMWPSISTVLCSQFIAG